MSDLPRPVMAASRVSASVLRILACAVPAIVLLAGMASAKPLFETPIYNPETKSYFELVPKREADGSVSTLEYWLWRDAELEARQRVYKGVPGRLAIARTQETRQFLLYNFRTDIDTWIGLLYHCDARELVWPDGSTQGPDDFKVWAKKWDYSLGGCRSSNPKDRFLGIAFTPADRGFRWVAHGSNKGFHRYFVEYPTGGP